MDSAGALTAATAAYEMGSGRLGATVAAVLGLIAVVIGGLALARPAGRYGAAALVVGLVGLVLGGLFAATADGGPGTGNGMAGAVVAVVLGLIGAVLGGLALSRSRRVG